MDLTIEEGTRKAYRASKMYSKVIGHNLLARIIEEVGYEILFQFGITAQIIQRMSDKGLLGGEIDLLSVIWNNRHKFKIRYLQKREFELLREIRTPFITNFYIKPVLCLSLERSTAIKSELAQLKKGTSYDTFMLYGKYRQIIDRTKLFDALIFFIVQLHKLYEQDEQILKEVINYEFGKESQYQSTRIYYEAFYNTCIDIDASSRSTIVKIAKKTDAMEWVSTLYQKVRVCFSAQGIGNIQAYCIDKCGPLQIKFWNHTYNNFASHYRFRHLPNIFLADVNGVFAKLHKDKNK